MTGVLLPALRGDDHLGFLATLGLTWLLHRDGRQPRIGWPQGATAGVSVSARGLDDVDAFAGYIHDVAVRMKDADQLWFGCDDLPLRKVGTKDPMNSLDVDEVRAWMSAADRKEADERWWLPAFANQLALDSDGDGPLRSPLHRPTGNMALDNNLSLARDLVAADEAAAQEALSGWRRHSGYFGGNLDQRAARGMAAPSDGKKESGKLGVPGATWLAYHALPWFPGYGDGRHGGFRCWQRVRRGGRTSAFLVWPVWTSLHGFDAVWTVLDHPTLRLRGQYVDRTTVDSLRVLGIEGVYTSRSMTAADVGKKSGAGPLSPAERVWPGVGP